MKREREDGKGGEEGKGNKMRIRMKIIAENEQLEKKEKKRKKKKKKWYELKQMNELIARYSSYRHVYFLISIRSFMFLL